MKRFFRFSSLTLSGLMALSMVSCSDKDDEPENTVTVTVGFQQVPDDQIANSEYGSNLYNGDISTGYLAPLYGDTYAQFSINYAYNYNADYSGQDWQYSLLNGGFAVSKYHNMTESSYNNQLSVYNTTSPSGGNFVVAFGDASEMDSNYLYTVYSDPNTAVYSNYEGCAKVYITDSKGYGVAKIGQPGQVTGDSEEAWFKSVYIANTTYTFFSMKNGNSFSQPLNAENKGWFKVQFIAFDDDDPNEKPLGYVEAYLANFDSSLAGGWTGIQDEWIQVDLSPLPKCSILVINFVGSDTNNYGLVTPAYCALDQFEITVEKD